MRLAQLIAVFLSLIVLFYFENFRLMCFGQAAYRNHLKPYDFITSAGTRATEKNSVAF